MSGDWHCLVAKFEEFHDDFDGVAAQPCNPLTLQPELLGG